MKIEFIDKGVIATAIVTSTAFEFRLHNRAVDTALFLAPSVRSKEGANKRGNSSRLTQSFHFFSLSRSFLP